MIAVGCLVAFGAAPAVPAADTSHRTLGVGLEIDRDQSRLVAFTLKDRPFGTGLAPEPKGDERASGMARIELRLQSALETLHVRSVELGPICLAHGADAEPHVQGDTIVLHRDAFVVELPEIPGASTLEVAYLETRRGKSALRIIGRHQLGRARYAPSGGRFSYDDLLFASPPTAAEKALEPPPAAASVVWPEDVGDPDLLRVYGDPAAAAERINVVIVPDGYTHAQKALLESHTDALVEHFRQTTPFAEHDAFFNYTVVYAYSVESGTDQCDCGLIVDSAMGTRFPAGGAACGHTDNRCLYYGTGCDTDGAANITAAELRAPYQDATIVMVNTERYGGCGGARAVYSAASGFAQEVAVHELGHSLARLADEYAYVAGCGTSAGGINTSLDPVEGAWPEWIGDLGAPREGAQYRQSCVYRPIDNCKMRALGVPFCPVCNQRWSHVIFGHPRVSPTAPIRTASPDSPLAVDLGASATFSVTTRLGPGDGNRIEWTLEAPGELPEIVAAGVPEHTVLFDEPGHYVLRCEVVADTDFVKPERNAANRDIATWLIDVDCADLDADGYVAPTHPVCSYGIEDCDDSTAEAWALPGEPHGALFTDIVTLAWAPPPDLGGTSVAYDVLRSPSAQDFGFGAAICLESDDGADTLAVDFEIPPSDSAFHYLVVAENPCGPGPLGGQASFPRSARTCP